VQTIHIGGEEMTYMGMFHSDDTLQDYEDEFFDDFYYDEDEEAYDEYWTVNQSTGTKRKRKQKTFQTWSNPMSKRREFVQWVVDKVEFPEYVFRVVDAAGLALFVQGEYWEADTVTGVQELQKTRLWLVADQDTEDEIVRTMFQDHHDEHGAQGPRVVQVPGLLDHEPTLQRTTVRIHDASQQREESMTGDKAWPCGRLSAGSDPKDDLIPCGTKLFRISRPRTKGTPVCNLSQRSADVNIC